jgi:beta-N-acetylhexosaminidase
MSDSLDRLANGCILAGFAGTTAPDGLARARRRPRRRRPVRAQRLRAGAAAGADGSLRCSAATVVAIDEEGGDVTRLEAGRGSSLPGAFALGTIDDVALTEQIAAASPTSCAAAGITLNLAPVADINVNPLNP